MSTEVGRAHDDVQAMASEHSDGEGAGARATFAHYRLDEEDVGREGVMYAMAVVRDSDSTEELLLAIAGVYGAGVVHGLRIAEERARGDGPDA